VVIFAAVLVHNADTILASGAAIQRQVIFGGPLAFLAGALMHESKKPMPVDLAIFAVALLIWGYTVSFSYSYVMSGMTFGMLVVCGDAARTRQRARNAQK
jgi:diacylglycerol kinase (ATP)